jgi:hypothetical protein
VISRTTVEGGHVHEAEVRSYGAAMKMRRKPDRQLMIYIIFFGLKVVNKDMDPGPGAQKSI